MTALKIVYTANVLVAGWIGITSLFFPSRSAATIFQQAYPSSDLVRLVGCLWLAICLLSVLGWWQPVRFSPVLLLQLIYKVTWLIVVALPAICRGEHYPTGMAGFFLVWVLVLPFVIPWSEWLNDLSAP